MTQLDQNIIKGLDDAAIARVYHRKRQATHKAATITQTLALGYSRPPPLLTSDSSCFVWVTFQRYIQTASYLRSLALCHTGLILEGHSNESLFHHIRRPESY